MWKRLPTKLRWAFGVPIAFIVLFFVSWMWRLTSDSPLRNIRVEGVVVPTEGSTKAYLLEQSREWEQRTVAIEAGFYRWRATRMEAGASRPIDQILTRILELGRSGNPFRDFTQWIRSLTSGFDLVWTPSVDRSAVQKYVNRIRQRVERLPTASTYGVGGDLIPGLHGEMLDSRAITVMVNSLRRGRERIRLVTHVTDPLPTREFTDPQNEADQLLIEEQTCYSLNNKGRTTNIELAARLLDGQIMLPGASLSFNQVVGERTLARGFAVSKEIRNREIVDGVGGGVCQVAATLHSAAFFSGLAIDEYRPHSRLNQFAYIDIGLDAMVSWPNHDLVIRNIYPFPIIVKTAFGAGICRNGGNKGVLKVRLLGAGRVYYVEMEIEETGFTDPSEIRRPDPSMVTGTERVVQNSQPGRSYLRTRIIVTPTGRKTETNKLYYPPVDRIVLEGTSGF